MGKMRRLEPLGLLFALSVGLLTFLSSLFGDVEGAGEWDWLAGLGFVVAGLLWAALLRRTLKKAGIPWWCPGDPSVGGRRRFHRFKDTGEKNEKTKLHVVECSVCAVRREVYRGPIGYWPG